MTLRELVGQKPLTLVMAHPDDEIFLWPFLPYATRVVACVSDEDNAERPAWGRRLEAFRAVCDELGVQSHCLEMNSGFYRMPRPGIEMFGRTLHGAIEGTEIVATHNAWGEYGHLDHILCHQVARAAAKVTLTTDIRIQRDWLPVGAGPQAGRSSLGLAVRDRALFDRVKKIYAERIPWPEDIPVADACEVFVC